MVGYGPTPPDPQWPGGAKIAVQFVLNYEEGSENNVLENDRGSETFLSEMIGAQSFPNRHMSMESLYEYGSRAGVWRILRTFSRRGLPLTIFAVAQAMARNPEAAAAFVERGDEIACHGYRWLSYQMVDEHVEREHMRTAIDVLTEITGSRPLGWYTGRDSPNTRSLVVEQGGFVYDSDSYADDLPYWVKVPRTDGSVTGAVDHLVVPYTLDTNDMRFASPGGFPSGEQFFAHLRDAFDVLYRCSRSDCIAGSSGAPPDWRAWSDSSTTSSPTTMSGSPAASTSPNTGARCIRRRAESAAEHHTHPRVGMYGPVGPSATMNV
jgi:peptidoglycan/xylan/chitin deacetylase (PgdA/CDA1 family)